TYTCIHKCVQTKPPFSTQTVRQDQGWTDNSWGPRAIRDHGAPVSLPKFKKAYEKGTRGHFMGPPTDPRPSGSAQVFEWSVRPCVLL
ncbi:unnamed protein product, partial [Staurois parvus]